MVKGRSRGVNGRQKGARGERQVAELLTNWWQAIEPGCEFIRTPSSGGWANPQVRGHFKTSGDLMTTAQRWPFSVEVKHREGWSVERLERGMSSPVWGWWRQAIKASIEEKREPMLWFRKNLRSH